MKVFTDKIGVALFVDQVGDSPASMAYLEAHFNDTDPEAVDALLALVDESVYSLREWVRALREVGHWLDARNMRMEMIDQIGYISCAAASAGAGANMSHLPSLVDDMLQAYGCERAVKR